jgi:hypothetical protein
MVNIIIIIGKQYMCDNIADLITKNIAFKIKDYWLSIAT